MKASEVLKRYAEGRRDFRGENLRGLSFRGKDLSGADFSEADIRGTNFRDATLTETKFIAAKAGLQKRWVILLLMVCLVLVVLSGFVYGSTGHLLAQSFTDTFEDKIIVWISVVVLMGFHLFIICQGISGYFTFFAIAISFIIALIIITFITPFSRSISIAVNLLGTIAIGFTVIFTLVFTFTTATAIVFTIAFTIAIVSTIVFTIAFTIAIVFAIAFSIAYGGFSNLSLQASMIVCSIVSILGLLSPYIGWQAIKGDEKYTWIRGNAVAIAATGGTCFRNADLTDADFSTALLKNTDLRSATLIRTCWRNAKKLDLARVGGTILFEATVRELLVTGKGHRKSFVDFNLRGANLTDTDLSYANLRQADLSQATLRGANLEGANLTETNCVGADFTAATLTAARLDAWNIDSTTILEQVNCDYVFLLEEPNPKTGSRERRPHDPDAVFQPGDFEKLYRQIMNTVEILLRNGINRDAFKQAFNHLIGEHPEIDYNSIQSIEKKGEDVLVKIAVPEETDKGQVERQFLEVYEARLEAAKQIALLEAEVRHNQDLTQIIYSLSERSPSPTVNLNHTMQQETKTMSDNQEIQTGDVKGNFAGSVGGNFDASGAILNIDNIKSQVSNSINELPPSPEPEQPGIKELLEQLQTAISDTPELSDDDKAQALEQVQALAEAGQNPKDGTMQQKAKGAMRFLKGLLAELPTAVKLVEHCKELLPAIREAIRLWRIASFFGLG